MPIKIALPGGDQPDIFLTTEVLQLPGYNLNKEIKAKEGEKM